MANDASSYRASAFGKWISVSGLVMSTLVSCLLMYAASTSWSASGAPYEIVSKDRASVQIAVQLISYLLGTTQVYAICSLIKFSMNMRMDSHPMTLDGIQFITALAGQTLDASLPWLQLLLLLLFLVAVQIPAALWAGAITPVLTEVAKISQDLSVAQYSNASMNNLGMQAQTENWAYGFSPSAQTSQGLFHYSPLYFTQSLFLIAAGTASTRDGSPPIQSKIDKSGFFYLGRSYGTAAQVGLVDTPPAQRYQYYERGYISNVTCKTNESADLVVNEIVYGVEDDFDVDLPNLYIATGSLPNGNINGPPVTPAIDSDSTVCSIVGCANEGRYLYGFAAGSGHAMFNQVQCEAVFTPGLFNIIVDTKQKLITVQPENTSTEYEIDSTGIIKDLAFRQPWIFSMVDTTVITNIVANTFIQNVENVAAHEGLPPNTVNQSASDGNVTDSIRFKGIAEAFESLLDNSLLTFASAQIMAANDTQTIQAILHVDAIHVGKDIYIYLTFVLNLVIVALYSFEMWRTRVWAGLSKFDITAVKHAIIGASAGGTKIAESAGAWTGDGADSRVGDISVVKRGIALTFAGARHDGHSESSELLTRNETHKTIEGELR